MFLTTDPRIIVQNKFFIFNFKRLAKIQKIEDHIKTSELELLKLKEYVAQERLKLYTGADGNDFEGHAYPSTGNDSSLLDLTNSIQKSMSRLFARERLVLVERLMEFQYQGNHLELLYFNY